MTGTKRITRKAAAMTIVLVMALCLFVGALAPSASAATIGCYDTGYRYNPGTAGLPYEFAAHWGLAYAYSSNGMPAYCIEMLNHEFYGGTDYYATTDPIGALSNEQRAMLAQVLAHGYDGSTKYGGSAIEEQLATQVAVWLVATNNCWGGSGYDAVLNGFVPNTTIGYIARRIIDSCTLYMTVPSFTANNAASAPTYEMTWDDAPQTYTISLTDTNGVLADYNYSAPEGLSIQRNGNTLAVTGVLADPINPVTLTATKPVAYSKATIVYLYYGSAQIIVYNGGTVGDPVQSSFKLKIKGGNLDLEKTSEDGIVVGMKFHVYCESNGFDTSVSTDAAGSWRLTGLMRGTYTIEEVETDRRYYQPDPVTVEVLDGGRTVSVSMYNDCKEDMKIIKTSEDGEIEGFKFHVTCAELGYDETVVTDENGEFLIKYLDPATYTVQEIEIPDRYQSQPPVEVVIERGVQLVEVPFENKLKTAQVELQKLSNHPEDMIAQELYNKPLAGAVYGIYCADTDELVTKMTTAGVMGKATSEVFKYAGDGEFYIQEITPPKYYAHDTNKYYFTMTRDHELFVREVKNDTLIGKLTVWYKEVETERVSPNTGDTSNLTPWLLLGGFSLAAMVALGVGISTRKKKIGTEDYDED